MQHASTSLNARVSNSSGLMGQMSGTGPVHCLDHTCRPALHSGSSMCPEVAGAGAMYGTALQQPL